MAKYQVLGSPHIQNTPEYRQYQVGEVIELPDDELPSENWLPLDEPAKLSMDEQLRLNAEKAQHAGTKDHEKRTMMPLPKPPWDGPVKCREAGRLERKKQRMKAALDAAPPVDPQTMSEIMARNGSRLQDLKIEHLERVTTTKSKRAADQEQ